MVNKVTFVGFMGGDRPNRPHWIRPWLTLRGLDAVCSSTPTED